MGLPGYWVVFFMRAATMTPRPVRSSSRPLSRTALLSSGSASPWTPDFSYFRGCTQRLTCSRAYASTPPLPTALQGSLLTRRARLWSDGIRTRWTTSPNFDAYRIPSPFGPAGPGRFRARCIAAPTQPARAKATDALVAASGMTPFPENSPLVAAQLRKM